MYMADIKYADIGNALAKGYDIKRKKQAIDEAEEKKKEKEATNEYFGNYLTKTSPENAVAPVDENKNGVIDPEETKNALQQTGRKYKAWDTVRDDEEISANRKDVMAKRAAAEGRAIREEQRAIEKHKEYMERNELAASQKEQRRKSYLDQAKELGYTGARAQQFADLAMKDENLAAAAFRQLDFNDKIKKTAETDETQKQQYLITKAYTDNIGEGKPQDQQKASAAALKQLNTLIDGMDAAIMKEEKAGNTKKALQIKKTRDEFKTMIGEDGMFDYQRAQRLAGKIAQIKQDQKLELDNQEDKKYLDEYWGAKAKSKKGQKPTAVQKTANYLGEELGENAKKSYLKKQAYGDVKDKPAYEAVKRLPGYSDLDLTANPEKQSEAMELADMTIQIKKKNPSYSYTRAAREAQKKLKGGNTLKPASQGKKKSVGITKNKKLFGKDVEKDGKMYHVNEKGEIFTK